ncbi:uncharacterized protein DS421_5g171500 [Arachis hypogaea]|nr:uncharacterized protein DS421_5g171500 [Arachis hypogaea]
MKKHKENPNSTFQRSVSHLSIPDLLHRRTHFAGATPLLGVKFASDEEALPPYLHFCKYDFLLVSLVLCHCVSLSPSVRLSPSLSLLLSILLLLSLMSSPSLLFFFIIFPVFVWCFFQFVSSVGCR